MAISGGADAGATSVVVETLPEMAVGALPTLVPGETWTFPGDPGAPFVLTVHGPKTSTYLRCSTDAAPLVVPASLTTALVPYVPDEELTGYAGYAPTPIALDTGNGVVLRTSMLRYTVFGVTVAP